MQNSDGDAPRPTVTITWAGDQQSFRIDVDGTRIIAVNQDEHGSAGMSAVETTAAGIAAAFGVSLTENDDYQQRS